MGSSKNSLFLNHGLVIMAAAAMVSGSISDSRADDRAPKYYPAVNAVPVTEFRTGKPGEINFGPLRFLGGLNLQSNHKTVAGYSGLAILDGGQSLMVVSDFGYWGVGTLEYDDLGRLSGLTNLTTASLTNQRDEPIGGENEKSLRDAEALAIEGDNLLIAFERQDRILAYQLNDGKPQGAAQPIPLPNMSTPLHPNKGIEALAVAPADTLLAGSAIAIAELPRRGEKDIPAWLFGDEPGFRFYIKRLDDFDVTGATFLPDGDLLILQRRFTFRHGIAMRLIQLPASEIAKNKVVEGELLLEADFSFEIDNMEGVAVHQDKKGQTIVSLISDNNRSPLQRTLLLQFALEQ